MGLTLLEPPALLKQRRRMQYESLFDLSCRESRAALRTRGKSGVTKDAHSPRRASPVDRRSFSAGNPSRQVRRGDALPATFARY